MRRLSIILLIVCLFHAVGCSQNTKKSVEGMYKADKRRVKTNKQPIQIEKKSYSELTITDIHIEKDSQTPHGVKVIISGTTDLPDGAEVFGGVAEWYPISTMVSNGHFTFEHAPQAKFDLKKEPYKISVTFTPMGQSETVSKLVGEKGENLTGKYVKKEFDLFKTLEIVINKELFLPVTSHNIIVRNPIEIKQGTPERTLAEYMWAWKNKNWQQMSNHAQVTWLNSQDDAEKMLESWYDFKELKGYEIINSDKVSDVTYEITLIIYYKNGGAEAGTIKKEIKARIIKEMAPYNPSENGTWGVNPVSTLRESDVE